MERRLQEAFELACSACELPVPRIVSAPRTEDLVMTISNVCVCDFAWLAQLLDKVSKNEQFAALVGVAGHEMSHTIDPKFWPRIERERLADVFAGNVLRKLKLPTQPYKKWLQVNDQKSPRHPPTRERWAAIDAKSYQAVAR